MAALDSFPIRAMIMDAVRSCLFVLNYYWTISPVAIVGSVAAVGGILWLVSNAARLLLATRAARRSHRVTLAMVGRNGQLGVTVIDHPSVNIYCVPGDGGRVVVTSGALEALSPRQLAAVVAHERAHMSGRHHLITTTMQLLKVSSRFYRPYARHVGPWRFAWNGSQTKPPSVTPRRSQMSAPGGCRRRGGGALQLSFTSR